MSKMVAVSNSTHKKLDDISRKRKLEEHITRNKKDILTDLVDKLHAKEVKS